MVHHLQSGTKVKELSLTATWFGKVGWTAMRACMVGQSNGHLPSFIHTWCMLCAQIPNDLYPLLWHVAERKEGRWREEMEVMQVSLSPSIFSSQ